MHKIFLKQVERIFCPEFALLVAASPLKKQKHPFGQAAKQQNKREKNQSVWHTWTIESIRKQLEKPQTWFCKYFPKRIRNVGEKEVADRQMVYDFKDGRSFEAVAQMTAASLKKQYGDGCKDIVFVPVPASTSEKNELRYKTFCERVCALTGAINGYEHVKVIGGRHLREPQAGEGNPQSEHHRV